MRQGRGIEEIETEVFAELPSEYRKGGARSAWLDGQLRGASIDALLEGPTFDRQGNLWVVDVAHGRIFSVSSGGQFELRAEYDGEPNGLALHKDGRFFVADHKHGIMLFDPETGDVKPYLDRPRLERFKGVNDLTFAENGDLYFTDQGQTGLHDPTGRVYRLRSSGELECLLDNVPSPNGLVLDKNETALFVAVTRANAVWRVPFMLDDSPSKVGALAHFNGLGGPDGLALDADGGIAVAHIDLGTIWLLDSLGEISHRVRSCAGLKTTNIAFGGSKLEELYISEASSACILRCRVPRPGKPLFSHS